MNTATLPAAASSTLGRIVDANTLRMERTLDAPVDKVWNFLVDPDKRKRWLCGGTRAAQAGDAIELRFENATLTDEKAPPRFADFAGVHVLQSRVVEIDAPRRLVISWGEGSPHASEVSFELAARGERTQLVLVHSRIVRRAEMLNVSGGWHAHLDLLDDVLAGREPRPFWTNLGERQDAYAPLIPA